MCGLTTGDPLPAYSLDVQQLPRPFVDLADTWYQSLQQSDRSLVDEGGIGAGAQGRPQTFLPNSPHSYNLRCDPAHGHLDGFQQLSSPSNACLPEALHAGMGDTYAVSNTISPQQEVQPDVLLLAEFPKDITSTEVDWSLHHGKDTFDFYNDNTPATQNAYQTALGLESISADQNLVSMTEDQPENPREIGQHDLGRYRCVTCGLRFSEKNYLYHHGRTSGHGTVKCLVLGCPYTPKDENSMASHLITVHSTLLECNQCNQAFGNLFYLGSHASQTDHQAFLCSEEDCRKAFSRFDVWERHQNNHRADVQRYPCPHCRRHRGADGFKRKDHLTQHLRNYHHIGVDEFAGRNARQQSCPHEDCPDWRPKGTWGRGHAFQKSSDYISHMRKIHKESEFPCTEAGCDRTGPKGYFRRRDLLKHKLKEHDITIE